MKLSVHNDLFPNLSDPSLKYSPTIIPFQSSITVPSGFTDITNIDNWDKYWSYTNKNYKSFRNILIDDFVGDWNTLSSGNKKILVSNFVYPSGTTDGELDTLYTSAERTTFNTQVMTDLNIDNQLVLRSFDNPRQRLLWTIGASR